jgi:hypothetical protein
MPASLAEAAQRLYCGWCPFRVPEEAPFLQPHGGSATAILLSKEGLGDAGAAIHYPTGCGRPLWTEEELGKLSGTQKRPSRNLDVMSGRGARGLLLGRGTTQRSPHDGLASLSPPSPPKAARRELINAKQPPTHIFSIRNTVLDHLCALSPPSTLSRTSALPVAPHRNSRRSSLSLSLSIRKPCLRTARRIVPPAFFAVNPHCRYYRDMRTIVTSSDLYPDIYKISRPFTMNESGIERPASQRASAIAPAPSNEPGRAHRRSASCPPIMMQRSTAPKPEPPQTPPRAASPSEEELFARLEQERHQQRRDEHSGARWLALQLLRMRLHEPEKRPFC